MHIIYSSKLFCSISTLPMFSYIEHTMMCLWCCVFCGSKWLNGKAYVAQTAGMLGSSAGVPVFMVGL